MRHLLLGLALAFPGLCAAQDDPILVGAAIRSRPAFDGSSTQSTDLVPVLRYYGRPWFARTTQGVLEAGVRSELAADFWAGAQLAYEAGRDQPQLDHGASVGLHLEWDRHLGRVPLTFLLRARQHLDTARGGQADVRVTAGVLSRGALQAGMFAQATYGSENAVASMYGPAKAGLLFLSGGLLGSYDLTRHWVLVASFELRVLRDEAKDSGLSERISNRYLAGGAAYRF